MPVNPDSITVTPPENLTYDGSPKEHTATASVSGGFTYSYAGVSTTVYSASSRPPTNAGTYRVTVTPSDSNYSGSKSVDFTIAKATPSLTVPPTASASTAGQALSNSTISDGTVTPSGGTWAWSNPGNTNTVVGTNSYPAVYTPALADQGNYLNLTTDLSVTVNSAGPVGTTYSGWLISNVANGSDAAFWDYVYGATAPGQLPASLRPTTVITGGNLVLTYYVRQNTIGLTVTAKKSLDLATGPSGWNIDGVTDQADGAPTSVNGVSVQKRTASVAVSGANKKFLKLEGVQTQ